MSVDVGINGFGRVGRSALRAALERHLDIRWAGVNDVMDAPTAAHLLKYDSTYGPLDREVIATDRGLRVGDVEIPMFHETDPASIPWADAGAEVVIESTGRFRDRASCEQHIEAGARTVIVSAPAKDPDVTVALGVNFERAYDPERHRIVSNASCTTNCLAPVAKILHETVGIKHGLMTTVHAYTGDQQLLDLPHKDLRRARSAAVNVIPTSTGAAKALGLVLPELEGRLQGYALRVPVVTGSVVDLTVETERPTSAEEINDAFRERADTGELEGILACTDDPIVSTDVIGSPYSAIFDAALTSVVDHTGVKVVAWYDNEWGYSNRIIELAARVLAPAPAAA